MGVFGHNSTIEKKQKTCVRCGKPCFWFSKKRCQSCAKIEDTFSRMEKSSDKNIEEEGLMDLVKEADSLVSLYVRLKNADEFGNVQCYTCPTILPYSEMQAGHYISRAVMLLRFDMSRNLRPQCPTCNCLKHGNLAVYSQNLEKEKPGLPDILYEESVLVYKVNREEVRAIIAEYKPKVEKLKKQLNHGKYPIPTSF